MLQKYFHILTYKTAQPTLLRRRFVPIVLYVLLCLNVEVSWSNDNSKTLL